MIDMFVAELATVKMSNVNKARYMSGFSKVVTIPPMNDTIRGDGAKIIHKHSFCFIMAENADKCWNNCNYIEPGISIFVHTLCRYMTPHYVDSGPLSDDTLVRELMAKTLVVGTNTTQDWIDIAGVYWTNSSTWWNLVGAHPIMDQYRVSNSKVMLVFTEIFSVSLQGYYENDGGHQLQIILA